jgi:hypothetical protein
MYNEYTIKRSIMWPVLPAMRFGAGILIIPRAFALSLLGYGSGCVIIQTFTAYADIVILTVYGLLRRYLDRVTSPMDGPSGELGVVLNWKKGLRLSLVDAEC